MSCDLRVHLIAASGFDRGLKGFGTQLSISGGRPVQNNYRIDGLSVNDYANGGPSNVIGGALGVDAIQEFSVITSNYTAQYGRTSGGVVNAITKSGTNDLHGSAYEFIRNSALDARNYFDFNAAGNPVRPPFRRNQFGGSLGGPISKGHTFIFGDYEGIRQSKGIATQAIVPSVAARAGNLTTGHVNVDPAAARYLALYPLPNLSREPATQEFTRSPLSKCLQRISSRRGSTKWYPRRTAYPEATSMTTRHTLRPTR